MDIQTWEAMLERRGYSSAAEQKKTVIQYKIRSVNGTVEGTYPAYQFNRMLNKNARKKIDQELGHGMQHCIHTCGYPVLRARAGYTCLDPFFIVEEPLLETQYYRVSIQLQAELQGICPRCGHPLNAKTVKRVKDPEVDQQT